MSMIALDLLASTFSIQQFPTIDFAYIFQERWMFIVPVIAIIVIYLLTMEIRRFITIIGLSLLFQFMWESIHMTRCGFPFFSLEYIVPRDIDFYIMTLPAGIVFIKGIIPLAGCYIFSSMATRKMIHSKMDMVSNRGRKVTPHMASGILGAGVYTIVIMIMEPLLANGSAWLLGQYERFGKPIYYGVDPMYFLGAFITAMVTYLVIGMLEARIEYDDEDDDVFYDFEGVRQKSDRYQIVGFIIVTLTVVAFSFIALFIDITMGMIDIVVGIPCIFTLFLILSKFSDARERINVGKFCDDNPGSFLCDL